ncbi:MAG: pseudouridine synthase [Chlamydiales bacterium]
MTNAYTSINILYEDNHLLVIDKPAGLLTQPTENETESAETWGKEWIRQHKHKTGNVFLHPIHRIDKPVSGIVVFAKTSKALSRLQKSMREARYRKMYRALVSPSPKLEESTLQHCIVHGSYKAFIDDHHPDAKEALLNYRVIEKFPDGSSLLEIELITGRYHQIRVQMQAIGSPIVGDIKYGSEVPYKDKAIALHHYQMEILHPITQQKINLISTCPFDLR